MRQPVRLVHGCRRVAELDSNADRHARSLRITAERVAGDPITLAGIALLDILPLVMIDGFGGLLMERRRGTSRFGGNRVRAAPGEFRGLLVAFDQLGALA